MAYRLGAPWILQVQIGLIKVPFTKEKSALPFEQRSIRSVFLFFFCILKLQPPFVFLSLGLFSLVNGYFINVAVVK